MNEEAPRQPADKAEKLDQPASPAAGLPIDKFFQEKDQIIQRERQRQKENYGPKKPTEQRGDTGSNWIG